MTEYRKISPEELKDILEKHKLWLDSAEEEGERADLNSADLSKADLREAALEKANLSAANLSGANLSGVRLNFADLSNSELLEANLGGAKLGMARLEKADLSSADLNCADLVESDLYGTNLRGAILSNARLNMANLIEADLRGADLLGADLRGADLRAANFNEADVRGVKVDRKTLFMSIRVATCYGSQHFQRFAMDQAYLEEMKEGSKADRFFYYLWLVLADCGRTVWYWLGWSVFLVLSFSGIFYSLGEGAWKMAPDGRAWGKLTALYYSVVTFTTLGFGDITPKTDIATWLVMAEVILGYVMLGGLISLMSTKLSRRS